MTKGLQTYGIYEEGYAITGSFGQARYLGTAAGKSFLDACKNYIKETGYGEISKDQDGKQYASNWGCRWFPTLEEAQRSFG